MRLRSRAWGNGITTGPFVRGLLFPATRAHRWFRVSIILGVLLLAVSPAVSNYNDKVGELRDDGISTAYFMRTDIAWMFMPGGLFLVMGGLVGFRAVRNVHGDWAQSKAALAAMGVYAFVVMSFAKGLMAVMFLPWIYNTAAKGRGNDPIAFDVYEQANMFVIFATLIVFILLMFYVRRQFREPRDAPFCQNCGYNLTGNTSGVCTECGRPVDTGETT